jgi:hypothetical protein
MGARDKTTFPASGPAAWKATAHPVYRGGGGQSMPTFVGILDQLSIAAVFAGSAARRLSVDYVGPLLRVRRSSDSAETNIGCNDSNILDESVLTSHTGANSGFIVTMFGQSAAGNNLTQATPANQPRIVDSGVIDKTANGQPASHWSGAGSLGLAVTGLSTQISTKLTVIALIAMDVSSGAFARAVSLNATGGEDHNAVVAAAPILRSGESFRGFRNTASLATVGTTYGAVRRVTSIWNGSTHSIHTNAAVAGTPQDSSGTFGYNEIHVGGRSGAVGDRWAGKIAEIIIINDVLPEGDLAVLEADIDEFYGL